MQSEHYVPLLIPIILERIPDDIKLEISRKLGTDGWLIEDFMTMLKTEIAARESCNFLKNQDGDDERSSIRMTTEAFTTGTKILVCAFCTKNHYSDKCTTVTEPEKRKDIARKERLCFKCLFRSHTIRNCRSRRNCFSCKSSSHHTAICDRSSRNHTGDKAAKKPDDQTEACSHVTTFIGSKTTVLLQTASGIVSDNYERRSTPVRIVLDSGAERTYITEDLVKKLNLTAISSHNVQLNTFGEPKGKSKRLNYYSFCVKKPTRGCNIYMTGFAVPTICVPLKTCKIDVVEEAFPGIKDIDLSEATDNEGDRRIDLLIGSDFYWSVIEDENKRFGHEGLVAVNSKLGWVLSGPLKDNECEAATATRMVAHVMQVGFNEKEEELLSAQVHKFWDMDTLGIKNREISVYDKFLDEIKFIDGRYVVRLPFNPILGGIFLPPYSGWGGG